MVGAAGAGGRRGTDTSRVSSVSSQFSDGPQHSPSSTHSSTPSWSEEPAQSNMDISTGHMILVGGKRSLACLTSTSCDSPARHRCFRRIWRITCGTRTASRRSGRLCVPTRLIPVQSSWLRAPTTWRKTGTARRSPVSALRPLSGSKPHIFKCLRYSLLTGCFGTETRLSVRSDALFLSPR